MPVKDSKLPCVCGSRLLNMWFSLGNYTIKCPSCGKEAYGRNKFEVVQNWNDLIKKERKKDG